MSALSKLLIGMVGIVLAFIIFVVSPALVYYNEAVQQEMNITAQYDQNRNNYTKMFNSLKEMVQVPEMYTQQLKEVYEGVMSNRYGKDGSKALFQWIQEHNPTFDSSLYSKIQSMIEANRNSFEANQKTLIDKKRSYETLLRQFPSNIFLIVFGFPKIDLNKYDIVTSSVTEDVFNNKQENFIELK